MLQREILRWFRLEIETSRIFTKLESVRERHIYVCLPNRLKKTGRKILGLSSS
jgi:hypothetical protein